ncbi:hypothetical protein OX90_09050 [Pseudomonas coronafaciens pv. porri]|uniref:Uncharacterized protein n=1 Tax=Pseudomonas coronafaciens pv. porri TaxID=83964 RepID=A0ABR5JQT2_9PSED|nr:hypothetical protein OX90_09050 [Pseudomonas coronafaciens pv. porri]
MKIAFVDFYYIRLNGTDKRKGTVARSKIINSNLTPCTTQPGDEIHGSGLRRANGAFSDFYYQPLRRIRRFSKVGQ